jgi:hypothetical protein
MKGKIMKKMILTAMMVIGLAVAAQQTANAGIFVRVGGCYPVAYARAYPYPCAAPVCPPSAPVYAPAPACAPAPVYYDPAPAYYAPAPRVVAFLPGVRIHVGHLHVWF